MSDDRDPATAEFERHRNVPVVVNGNELHQLLGVIDKAVAEAGHHKSFIEGRFGWATDALLAAQAFLRNMQEQFDAAREAI